MLLPGLLETYRFIYQREPLHIKTILLIWFFKKGSKNRIIIKKKINRIKSRSTIRRIKDQKGSRIIKVSLQEDTKKDQDHSRIRIKKIILHIAISFEQTGQ